MSSSKFDQLPFYDRYKNYLRNSIDVDSTTNSDRLTFPDHQSRMVAAIVTELADALLILNQGKENFFRIPLHVSMPDRYRYEYRDKQFDEQTLEPMQKALRRLTAVKLENEM